MGCFGVVTYSLLGPFAIFGNVYIGIFEMVKGAVSALVLAPDVVVSGGVS